MGTTVVAAMADGDKMSVAHVGDSRAYMIRNGQIKRITSDTFTLGYKDAELTLRLPR